MNNLKTKLMDVADLAFDVKNPRLSEFGLNDKSEEREIIRILWNAMDVKELVMSIAASGFFPHEPVIVAQENGQHIVIEGNRRLAAVNVLLNPDLIQIRNADIVAITEEAKKALVKFQP